MTSAPQPASNPTDVATFYDEVAAGYREQYRRQHLAESSKYPQNYYRLQLIVRRLFAQGCQSVYEVGTGEGTPLAVLGQMGLQVAGCDISEQMVAQTRAHLSERGLDAARVQFADIEDALTFANQAAFGPFDALIALGVMPHVKNDELALRNMRMLLRPGGTAFIEFRNKLMALFSFNRLTKEFILDDLLAGVNDALRQRVAADLEPRLAMDLPPVRQQGNVSYDTIRAKFHNPYTVPALLHACGFALVKLHWYHYHAAPPMHEAADRQLFWTESSKLEHHEDDWRGQFLCSAFVAEVTAC